MVNVTEFELQNISLMNFGKNHTAFINLEKGCHTKSVNKTSHIHYNYNSSILLYECALVRIINVNISVNVMTVCGKIVTQRCEQIFNFSTMKRQKSMKNYSCEIPEIAYNYQEFQDPIIGLDM